jgi:F-type H+-transporting ATPase subunit delta
LADVVADARLDPLQVERQVGDFAAVFAGSRELREALLNPSLSARQRIGVLDAVCGKLGAEPQVRNFMAVLSEHGRLGSLDEILQQYKRETNRRLGVREAEVVTARKLDDRERGEMERHVAALAGGEVRATFRQDASLIGGARIRMGSTVYDGSVRGRLERLRERLAAN